jgi:RNA polymerase sigma factor (sigma-70 family)
MNVVDRPEEEPLERLAAAANRGDGRALERLVRAVHDRVYRLAVRMTARPPDAEDATQEILIRVITRVSTYRGEAAFTTWVHRIAVNYLLDRAKSSTERLNMTFDRFAADLLDGLSAGPSAAPDAALLEREVQLACTHALLTCLDREHRVAYILGDIFGVDSDDGGYICDVPPATFRKRLSRARQRVREHLSVHCGLISQDAACRCSRRIDVAVRLGRIRRDRLEFVDPDTEREARLVDANDQIARLHDAANLLRALPAAVPAVSRERISAVLAACGVIAG